MRNGIKRYGYQRKINEQCRLWNDILKRTAGL
jgi:hypothetical protein